MKSITYVIKVEIKQVIPVVFDNQVAKKNEEWKT